MAPGICPPQKEMCFLSFTVKPRWLPLQQVKSTVSRDGGRGLLFILPHFSLNTCGWTLSDTLWNKRLLWSVLGKQPSLAFLTKKKKKRKCFEFWTTNFYAHFGNSSPVWESGMVWRQNCLQMVHLGAPKATLQTFERCSTPQHFG